MAQTQLQTNGLKTLKGILTNDNMRISFERILKENAGAFMASIIELYQSDNALQKCDPNMVVIEALKAATLKLPINKQLGFAYIIPYGSTPTFQMGYKGYIQLAQRSGQYRFINADIVYEGEQISYNRINGMLQIDGQPSSETPIGYFAYFQLLNGFEKCVFWSKDKVLRHAQRYSKSFKSSESPWKTNFDAMALKTVLRNIISKYGVMSIEFSEVVAKDFDDAVDAEVAANANRDPISLPAPEPASEPDPVPDTQPERAVQQSMTPADNVDGDDVPDFMT